MRSAVEFIAIGASLGGIKALNTLFASFPSYFSFPVGVVLHRSAIGVDFLAESLQKSTSIVVHEAIDKMPIKPDTITLAPADYHLLVDTRQYSISVDLPCHHARPSIDVFFESVADEYADKAVGIILTGGGEDGVRGLNKIKMAGGLVMVQAPDTAEDASLPNAAIAAGIVDAGLSLQQIGAQLALLAK